MYLMHVMLLRQSPIVQKCGIKKWPWAAINLVQGCADYFESEADTKALARSSATTMSSPSWEVNIGSITQEISRHLWNLQIR
jgi:hypothetical protein